MSDGPVRKFFGGLLIAVGVLVSVTSGGCSLVFAVGFLHSATPSLLFGWLLTVVFVGGLPFLFGVALIFGGRAVMGPSPPPASPSVPPPSNGRAPPDGPPRGDL